MLYDVMYTCIKMPLKHALWGNEQGHSGTDVNSVYLLHVTNVQYFQRTIHTVYDLLWFKLCNTTTYPVPLQQFYRIWLITSWTLYHDWYYSPTKPSNVNPWIDIMAFYSWGMFQLQHPAHRLCWQCVANCRLCIINMDIPVANVLIDFISTWS